MRVPRWRRKLRATRRILRRRGLRAMRQPPLRRKRRAMRQSRCCGSFGLCREPCGATANGACRGDHSCAADCNRPTCGSRGAAPQADPFEPPPPGMSAAQMQARAAGAVSPAPVPAAQASAYDAAAGSANQQTAAARAEPPTVTARAPDPIDAAADAFEPPPPASVAVRQARQAQQVDGNAGVQIMRASTASRGIPAPTQTTDDPIARFANGSY